MGDRDGLGEDWIGEGESFVREKKEREGNLLG